MSNETTHGIPQPEPKQGWSTKKKWVVGCSGCLGIVLIFVVCLGILVGMGFNSLKGLSDQSVASIFGEKYKPKAAMAVGMPIGQASVKSLAMLIYSEPSFIVFAAQSELSPEQNELITSGKLQQVQALIQKMSEEASESSQDKSSKFKSIRFNQMYKLNLAPNKTYTVCNATLEVDRRGTVAYMPTSIALLPEDNNNLVVLAALNPSNSTTDPEAKFDNVQRSMQEQLLKIIHESELANRISVTGVGSAKPSRPQAASGQG